MDSTAGTALSAAVERVDALRLYNGRHFEKTVDTTCRDARCNKLRANIGWLACSDTHGHFKNFRKGASMG